VTGKEKTRGHTLDAYEARRKTNSVKTAELSFILERIDAAAAEGLNFIVVDKTEVTMEQTMHLNIVLKYRVTATHDKTGLTGYVISW
jgi:hypothetical protein